MKNTFLFLVIIAFTITNCASKPTQTAAEAKKQLDDKYEGQIGKATKTDFVSEFGNAEWCKQETSGDETCRFYRKKGIKWIGDTGRDKKSYEAFDQIIAEFSAGGLLKSFKSSTLR